MIASTTTIRTPAKLNLGLEIVRRRDDGYHDIATIFQAVSIFDELSWTPAHTFKYSSDPAVPARADIARETLEHAARLGNWTGHMRMTKHIPISAGLGGGSSDAALALRLAALDNPAFDALLRAKSIGADVPFFVHGGTAFATGIGERLEPLPTPDLWFVILVPNLRIGAKTATMFNGLNENDFSDGTRVGRTAAALADDSFKFPESFQNAFERQFRDYPVFSDLWEELNHAAGRVALSGAGPAMYSWHRSRESATRIAENLDSRATARIFVAQALGPHRDDRQLHEFKRLLNSKTVAR